MERAGVKENHSILRTALQKVASISRMGNSFMPAEWPHFSIQLLDEQVCKLNWIAVMLERDASTFRHAGQLRVLNHGLAIEIHREPVALHGDHESIPLANRFVCFDLRCGCSAHLWR